MDWGNLLSYAVAIVALLAAGGVGLQRSRVTGLKFDLDQERGRNVTLRQDVADLKVSDADKAAKIAQLTSDLRHAEAMALGEQHWKALDQHAVEHHAKAQEHWKYERAVFDKLNALLVHIEQLEGKS